jgi:hypothetical protein
MTLQTDFRNVTNRIQRTRKHIVEAETERLRRRAVVTDAETRLTIARNRAMADPAAGTNETQRRAYADEATKNELLSLQFKTDDLRATEIELLELTADLRVFEDERRYLELVARLQIANARDEADDVLLADENLAPAYINNFEINDALALEA